MFWLHSLKIVVPILLLTACSTFRTPLTFSPGVTVHTFSAAVSLTVVAADHSMSGSGFLTYRRPDQLHLIILSPFGTTMMEAFAIGERITLMYPSSSIAYVGRTDELRGESGLQGWRMMQWIMDADPSPTSDISNSTIERTGINGLKEKVTYENGLLTIKRNMDGDQVYYSHHSLNNSVPFANEIVLLNNKNDRFRLVLDTPEVNTPLDAKSFTPKLDGFTILPLSELRF